MIKRERLRSTSNNPANTNKNICVLEVAQCLKVHTLTRYFHTISDLVYATRMRYNVRSRFSTLKGSIGQVRVKIRKKPENCVGYIVRVDRHVLFLSPTGETLIDTDPRKVDRRQATHIYIVYN